MKSTVVCRVDDTGLARLQLNRPDTGNAIDLTMAKELADVTTELGENDRVRAVLLTGAGERFCVGGDLKSFARVDAEALPAHLKAVSGYLHVAVIRLATAPFPVVAAVQGVAAGAGLSLACSSDVVVAGASARFVFAYGGVGLTPDGSASWSLPRLIGLRRSLDLALRQRPLCCTEAEEWGLITQSVPDDALADEAERIAGSLTTGPTRAFGATRLLLRTSLETSLEAQLEREAAALATAARSKDAREGIAAFVDGRPARFGGH